MQSVSNKNHEEMVRCKAPELTTRIPNWRLNSEGYSKTVIENTSIQLLSGKEYHLIVETRCDKNMF